ncbi:Uncharacterised protein [Escherichia coli]|uniref:Uncharacterized protein n=1 Tax=Escherichia coli TaxID=562 RepID=A0A376D930_ECOLX|nr:Uncharacterised protein [Escherichia coli]
MNVLLVLCYTIHGSTSSACHLLLPLVVERIVRMVFVRVVFVQTINSNGTGKDDIFNAIFFHGRQHIAGTLNVDIIIERSRADVIAVFRCQ